ncbi:alpha/beta fold hydrolase [Herbiconiux sp. VKM Ac-2851]|uniref:alpha/beta fold hydrolase n=1 Tax=Herbiconiux sp. VKM Ac-2851 TaxID=2739025 RepID=UPI001566A3C8|nr:alpha/beta hydrolase [Herbiconiux sp. VKM Ac-2851]NQX37126.1 alpha/beta hydrolase [Herbiconiux sp. VKM Ac-2851]
MTNIFSTKRGAKRRILTVAAGIAAVASLAVTGLAGASSASATQAKPAKPTVVIVHGAWTDASSFTDVEKILTKDGYPVLDFANPLRSLKGDSEYLASFLTTRTTGPVVLVGHSYGGAVISEAALSDPDVKSLVYVDAFVPAEGESLLDLLNSAGPVDPTQLFDTIPYPGAPEGDVDLYLKKDAFGPGFANGLSKAEQASYYAKQRPITFGAVNEKASATQSWKTLPSWYVAGTQDASIPLALQLKMADRAGSTVTEVKAGHLAMVKEPKKVAKVIETAATSK